MVAADLKNFRNLGVSKIGQIGIVVKDIARSMEYFSGLYDVGPWYRTKLAEEEMYYRGRKIDLKLDITIAFTGGVEIELIQVISGDENIYSSILEKQGGGVHHLGFLVTGFDRKLEAVRAMGVTPLQWGRLKTSGGAVTRFAYLDTIETCGVITEFIESKLYGVVTPHTGLLMEIGRLTGDVARVKL